MLKRIIPCLDVDNGRVVKGINFVNLVDAGDPAEQAKIYYEGGAAEICFLDITASHEKRNTMLEVVKQTTKKCFVRSAGGWRLWGPTGHSECFCMASPGTTDTQRHYQTRTSAAHT